VVIRAELEPLPDIVADEPLAGADVPPGVVPEVASVADGWLVVAPVVPVGEAGAEAPMRASARMNSSPVVMPGRLALADAGCRHPETVMLCPAFII
jgi:hypothetical protein